ncbi:MAG: hypothetical protein OZSIB_3163 [Candidatus Ozemobacter sibiricus]|jgi:hypothetical protein|uniref:PpiC domain-containing protein n=1 Tax=Candidatus Ozemobacter sibiricus TaxID=2268124 RepID=A0A367ZRE0_9BACT|nr:MAG: hypothetical protein OZSIB_3163 [Candidatus Ozemobacter sibiricus]
MNALRTLLTRVNTLLVMMLAGLALGLTLAWDYYTQRRVPVRAGEDYAAELLAYGLTHEALQVLQEAAAAEPRSARGLRLRRTMAELYMDRLGDYEKALAELVYVRSVDPGLASATEERVRRCLDRLGRTYDVQRRLMLEEGRNPLVSTVTASTAVRLGNQEAITVAEVERRLAQMGLPVKDPPREALDKLVQAMAGEVLLRRAAERAGVRRHPAFLEQVRLFEENLALQRYLEEHVLKDVQVDDQALDLYLQQHRAEFESPLRVIYSTLAFADQGAAQDFVAGRSPASAPDILADRVNALPQDLPTILKGIKWETEPPPSLLGPVEQDGKWVVYQIHEVVPPRRVPPELARQQARLRLLEQKQSGRLAEAIAELARREELKILDDVLTRAFYTTPPATGTAPAAPGKPAPSSR